MWQVCKNPGTTVEKLAGRYSILGKRTLCDVMDSMMGEGLLKMRAHQIPTCSLSSPAIPRYIPRLGRGLAGAPMPCDTAAANIGRYLIPGNTSMLLLAAGGRSGIPWGGVGLRQGKVAAGE